MAMAGGLIIFTKWISLLGCLSVLTTWQLTLAEQGIHERAQEAAMVFMTQFGKLHTTLSTLFNRGKLLGPVQTQEEGT